MRLLKVLLLLVIAPILAGGAMPPASERKQQREAKYPHGRIVYHASQSGWPTLDSDATGGNPFATAFIETLAEKGLRLSTFNRNLVRLTTRYSEGFQSVDIFPKPSNLDWEITPRLRKKKRVALVLIISDYSKSSAASLPGAEFDAGRVVSALRNAGFETELALNLARKSLLQKLKDFRVRSESADAAVIYTTGHGVEIDNAVHLLSGDYPIEQGRKGLSLHSYSLSRIADAASAKSVNLVFYAGCRDDPLK